MSLDVELPELLSLLSARRGHFELESGHHGDLWLELDSLFLHPRRLKPFIAALARQLLQYEAEIICGPLVGGALIAQQVAHELGGLFCYTERFAPPTAQGAQALYRVEYRLPTGIHAAVAGKTVAVVDDVINAGSAVRGTCEALRTAGAVPVVIGALLVLGTAAPDHFAAQQLAVESVARQSNPVWAPADCPLCAEQIPLEVVSAG